MLGNAPQPPLKLRGGEEGSYVVVGADLRVRPRVGLHPLVCPYDSTHNKNQTRQLKGGVVSGDNMGMIKKKQTRKSLDIIYHKGQATAVILDIEEYRKMLTALENIDDLQTLKAMRKQPLEFRKLDEYLAGIDRA